jgi:hypothetical protein
MFEKNMLTKMFAPTREKVTRGLGKLYTEELSNLYSSSNIIRMIKSKRIIWARHIARKGRRDTNTKIQSENLKGRDQLVDLGVNMKL